MRTSGHLEEIKARVDIVDLVSSYVQLKKAGQNWKGICPFHAEKTPSFMVSPSKQIFHCFGCSAGGDVITFMAKYENISFGEAVEVLAKKAGVALPRGKEGSRVFQKEERIRHALQEAADFFTSRLRDTAVAREYLAGRGVNEDSIAQFRIGFAPQGWDNLLKHLRKSGFGDDVIRDAGLAVAGNKGPYDMFRNRIIFPIMGTSGTVLAFGGRAMDDAVPKYINSPETAVYKKSDTLFGLHAAKEEIRRRDAVIIAEGYMDVTISHQFGFRNVVAPLGTSLTAGQAQKLRTMTGNAIIVFDGDDAGRAAARRALAMISQYNFRTRVLMLPGGEDPDSFLRSRGSEAFALLLEEARSMINFLVGTARGGKTAAVREALAVLSTMGDALLADELMGELADLSRINETTIRQEFRKMKQPSKGAPAGAVSSRPPVRSEERLLLSAVIAFPAKAGDVLSRLDLTDIRDKTVEAVFRRIASLGDVRDIADAVADAPEEERRLVTKLSVEPGFDIENADRNIEDCFRRIEGRKLEERLRSAQESGDLAMMNTLLGEKGRRMKEVQ